MSAPRKIPPAGQLRRSQIVTTFGPGAMLDLPRHAVIVGGLEHWTEHGRTRIHEPRLEAKLIETLALKDRSELAMYSPPVDDDDPTAPRPGITSFVFPAWFIAQVEGATFRDPHGRVYRTRPLVPWQALDGGFHYLHDRKKIGVVPVRFVQACPNGHINDIDWHRFVHGNNSGAPRGLLWIDEGGTGGDLSDIFIRCGVTGARRPLADAKLPDSHVLGPCNGDRPWLGRGTREACQGDKDQPEWSRLLVRSASNAYFAQTLRVISIPEAGAALRKAVDTLWDDELAFIDDLDDLVRLRRKNKPKVTNNLGALRDSDVWAEIQRRRAGFVQDKTIKQAELETLLAAPPDSEVVAADEGAVFIARRRTDLRLPAFLEGRLERVVLVHRLREVTAQIGFTRFQDASPDVDGELSLDVRRASLAREVQWLPAIEHHGEGVFLGFNAAAIDAWRRREPVAARGRVLEASYMAWATDRKIANPVFPGLPYLLLHSLAHLLIQAVAMECGYAVTALSERIYTGAQGHGILLYTGTTGSEGTLGGLVAVGRSIERCLAAALADGRLCSNDPICAEHQASDPHEARHLHGAACHGCLLIAEPSCERRNEFLDRALVLPTVTTADAAFFADAP